MFGCLHGYPRSLWILDHLCLWGFGRSIDAKHPCLGQAGSDGIKTWDVLVSDFNILLIRDDGLLIEPLELFRGERLAAAVV